jgi:hypothetical protein
MPIGIGGSNFIYPEFGEGLDGAVIDLSISDAGALMAVGGGENTSGLWRPQVWESLDGGLTWSNDELPLPLGVAEGEAMDCDHEVGHWQAAGWGRLAATGAIVPLLWTLDTNPWIVHELPLPPLDDGGQNASTHKLQGQSKYCNIVLKRGVTPLVGIWVDDPAGGWTLFEPEEYMLNPEIGTPVAPAGADKYGRIAVKFHWERELASSRTSAPMGTIAGLLIPATETGIDDGGSAPRWMSLSASPNPFTSGVRLGVRAPWDASVTVTVHDVTGRVVASLDEGRLQAGQERIVRWDGIDRHGARAAPGVYFVRAETPFTTSMLKLVRIE